MLCFSYDLVVLWFRCFYFACFFYVVGCKAFVILVSCLRQRFFSCFFFCFFVCFGRLVFFALFVLGSFFCAFLCLTSYVLCFFMFDDFYPVDILAVLRWCFAAMLIEGFDVMVIRMVLCACWSTLLMNFGGFYFI